ncbi:BZ3500_MvSof-1268-A1-R1_Chr1-3g01627 [Microbotryum saponariae]|uniref:BZ3500_MvSof-1268-A1-R1_Chr1-3g01627 protein n=1 Tax=Microbotryum saponariae TaxID=289078 RepID=A0A2X0MIY6_9BASI|nr:BZ3500_MvSof-1268-A1-R1_Chr1-3g01627 [Microbotryum saponariae]SCZ94180.1 BZ3501_MvSof-1269-A2-R1_Chr1-3g01228 [Microbotryum saponariae]
MLSILSTVTLPSGSSDGDRRRSDSSPDQLSQATAANGTSDINAEAITTPPASLPSTPPVLAVSELLPTSLEHNHPVNDSQAWGLATRLRRATAQAHHDVMLPRVVHRLSSGDLPLPVYIAYLEALSVIYESLERYLDLNATCEVLSPTYDPATLARSAAIEADLSYLTLKLPRANRTTSICSGRNWPSVKLYAGRLHCLGSGNSGLPHESSGLAIAAKVAQERPALLLAHAYTRYLGDLSGGQSIARSVRHAYSLPDSGEGSQFYELFPSSHPRRAGVFERANIQEIKDLKFWFRAGLDSAGRATNNDLAKAIEEEAKVAFKYNADIFSDLELCLGQFESAVSDGDKSVAESTPDEKGTLPPVWMLGSNALTRTLTMKLTISLVVLLAYVISMI